MPTCIYQAKKDCSLLLCVCVCVCGGGGLGGIKDLYVYVPDPTNSGKIMGCMFEKG
jgi:hypothetical protein